MSFADRVYRTCTYIAGDWTGDRDLIDRLHRWNEDERLGLSFVDVHDLTQSRDTSNPCSIKQNLRLRLSVTKTFVLIVGRDTDKLTKGGCRYCERYVSRLFENPHCMSGKAIDNRSFIEYECEMALKDFRNGLLKNIVVIYNGELSPVKHKCPSVLRDYGEHLGSDILNGEGRRCWNYPAIKRAICK